MTTFKHLARLCIVTSVCAACGAADSPAGPSSPDGHLTIDVRFLGPVTPQQQAVVAAAVTKWTRALIKDFGDFRLDSPANQCFQGQPALHETHHNPLIFFTVGEIDGPSHLLAYTQVCTLSGREILPIVSQIRLDKADVDSLEARGIIAGVVTHEMGHALGFNPSSYVPKSLASGGSNDPHFIGPTAMAEFALHGAWYAGNRVPLEDQSGKGPNDPHWRYYVFGDELMVAGVSRGSKSPLSSITLGLFKDLGYEVDLSAADPYEVTPPFNSNRLLPGAGLANDVRTIQPPTVLSPIVSH